MFAITLPPFFFFFFCSWARWEARGCADIASDLSCVIQKVPLHLFVVFIFPSGGAPGTRRRPLKLDMCARLLRRGPVFDGSTSCKQAEFECGISIPLTGLVNPTRQMECFMNPWDRFNASIEGRSPWKKSVSVGGSFLIVWRTCNARPIRLLCLKPSLTG